MKRFRTLLVLTALTIGASAFAGAQEFHNQRSGHQDQYQDRGHRFDRNQDKGVAFKYAVYDRDDRGRDRDDRWKVKFTFKDKDRDDHGRYESRDRR